MELRITSIQSNLHWENQEANLNMFNKKIEAIHDTDLIVLPEMFTSGFTMRASLFFDTMQGKTIDWMCGIANKKNAAICGSAIIQNEEEKFVNRFLFVTPNAEVYFYDKAHLFRMGDENIYYTKGDKKCIIQYKKFAIAPMVCYDLRFPVWTRRSKNFDYDILLFVANWPERRIEHWKALLSARAIENQAYVLGVNRVGEDGNNMHYSGETTMLSPMGEVLYRRSKEEDISTHYLTKNSINDYRKIFPVEKDADDFSFNEL